MKRKAFILLLGVLIVAVGSVVLTNREPSWKGRSLSGWLVDLDGSDLPENAHGYMLREFSLRR